MAVGLRGISVDCFDGDSMQLIEPSLPYRLRVVLQTRQT